MSENKQLAINYKEGSVVTYLRCGGVVNNQIKKVVESVNEKIKSANIWQSY